MLMITWPAAGATNLRDTDLTLVKLAEHCWEGGAVNCPIYHEDGPAVIIGNIQTTMTDLKANSISLPANGATGPAIVTFNDLRRLIRDIVYWPLRDFPLTTRVLADLSVSATAPRSPPTCAGSAPAASAKPLGQQCAQDGPIQPELRH